MKFTAASIIAIAAFLVLGSPTNAAAVDGRGQALAAADGGGFAATCRNLVITERRFISNTYFDLNANCEKMDYRWLDNRLQLGLCLANDHGVLKWSDRGNFDKSSYDQGLVYAEINLNERVLNMNGQLWCGDEIGIAW
ncbi:hypothetical protein LX32DRAFT_700492 [Colletotrichum zoysiae]|uniref:Cyanovirin-N domain-containing protein n=1 Tax=Colletotrichum zoysiae TaxID=1216348 RepID=A0AAD9MAM9_9PEZI|nr:hypothetical protein LX32DRAFT_700492 [Colletotrichum zoysiae]